MMSIDFRHFTGHSKTASLSNENEAGGHIEICFAPHKYSTFIYKFQIIMNIIVYMLGRELIEQPSYLSAKFGSDLMHSFRSSEIREKD